MTATETAALPAQTAAGTFPVDARTLRRALLAVTPHAARDMDLPSLSAVKLELRAGVLYLVATDRYCLAAARIPGTGLGVPDTDVLLDLGHAERLIEATEAVKGPILLGLSGTEVTADSLDGRTYGWDAMGSEAAQAWPDWRSLLRKTLTGPPAVLGDDYGLNAGYLARFDIGGLSADPLLFRCGAAGGKDDMPAVLVTRGDWFIAAVMAIDVTALGSIGGNWDAWTALTSPPAP